MDSRNGNSKGIERTRKRVASSRVASPRFAGNVVPPFVLHRRWKGEFFEKNWNEKKTSIDPVSPSETAR